MANITVSSSNALSSALKSAKDGDVINLTSGTYSLTANNVDKDVTITSSGSAVFNSLFVADSSDLTFDGVDFNGPDGKDKPFIVRASENITIRNGDIEGVANGVGEGRGFWAGASTDFTIENMKIHGFETGLSFVNIDGLTVQNNVLSDISLDGMIVGQIRGGNISNNTIDLDTKLRHSDGIQFWNNPPNNPSSDLVIEGNLIRTHNLLSHGIYMNNAVANKGGGDGSQFHDVVIKGNTVVSGDGFGIFWGQTNGLDITGNIVLRDNSLPADRTIPHIRVHSASKDVDVSGNVVSKATVPADANWQEVRQSKADWHISDKLIPVGSTLAQAQALLGNGAQAVLASVASDASEPAQGDTYSFDAMGKADVVRGLDFGAGDQILLHDFAAGTFGGADDGTSATIGSLDALRALDEASSAVSLRAGNDGALVIDIEQPGPDHVIRLVDLAHEYF